MKPAKEAAERFVKTGLAPGDRVAVVTVAQSQDYEFTGDVPKLVEQIAKVTSHRRSDDDSGQQCPHILPYEAYLIVNRLDNELLEAKLAECAACERSPCSPIQVTAPAETIWEHALNNSRNTLRVIESLVDGMAKLPGERMILLASAGFLTGNLETDQDRLMAKALHAEVVINTLDAKGLYTVIPGGDASTSRGLDSGSARETWRRRTRKEWQTRRTTPWRFWPPARAAPFTTTTTIWRAASGSWAWCRKPCTCSASRHPAWRPTGVFIA